MPAKPKTSTATAASPDFANFVDLLAIIGEGERRLGELQLDIDTTVAAAVDDLRRDYTDAQGALTQARAAIEALVAKHPEWFADKRTVKTPYGSVKVTRSTKLEVANPDVSILLIERDASPEDRERFLRTETALNLEVLETLTDAQLKAYRIERVKNETVKITAASIDLGKAVAAKTEEPAAVAA